MWLPQCRASSSCSSSRALNLDRGDGPSVLLEPGSGAWPRSCAKGLYSLVWTHWVTGIHGIWCVHDETCGLEHTACGALALLFSWFTLRRPNRAKRLVLCSWTRQESAKRSWFTLRRPNHAMRAPMRLLYISPAALQRPMWLVLCSWPPLECQRAPRASLPLV